MQFAILNRIFREGLPGDVTSEQRSEGRERGSHGEIREKHIPGRGTARAKALGQHRAWYVGGAARRLMRLEQSEQSR